MAFYALVTACLICERREEGGVRDGAQGNGGASPTVKLGPRLRGDDRWREVGEVIDLMVEIVGNDRAEDDEEGRTR
jgi:hypothetical protein